MPVGTLKKVGLDLLSVSDGAVDNGMFTFFTHPHLCLMGTCVAQIGLELIHVARDGHQLLILCVPSGSPSWTVLF